MTTLADLKNTAPEIAAYVERYYADQTSDTPILDILSPHHLTHQVADRWPDRGAAFYMLVAAAARECWMAMVGMPVEQPAPRLPRISSALAGLINSKDSSWF